MSLQLTAHSKLSVALKLHPDVLDYIVSLNPHEFSRLHNPLMCKLMPPRITLNRIAIMTNMSVGDLLEHIYQIAGITLISEEKAILHQDIEQIPTNPAEKPAWTANEIVAEVDLLEIDEALDGDPMPPISRALYRIEKGDVLLVKHKWEPQPLYDIWIRTGTNYYAEQRAPNEWWIYLRKGDLRKRKFVEE